VSKHILTPDGAPAVLWTEYGKGEIVPIFYLVRLPTVENKSPIASVLHLAIASHFVSGGLLL
jgi:hypothetical protein